MKLVSLSEHPSNLDPSARIVAAGPLCAWTIYSVKGGFVLVLTDGMAVLDLFPTEAAAHAAYAAGIVACRSLSASESAAQRPASTAMQTEFAL